jgi:hypothetical protein
MEEHMQKPKEIAEISLDLWYLPLEKVAEVKQLVVSLKQQCGYQEPTDDSDEWTDEDRREMTAAAMRRLDEEDPWPEDDPTSREQNDV